jgi:hypothetical protein
VTCSGFPIRARCRARTCESSGREVGAWRAFYRRVGAVLVVAAIAPEGRVDPQGFQRAIRAAERRLAGAEA